MRKPIVACIVSTDAMLKLITLLALVQPIIIIIIWDRRLHVYGQPPPSTPPPTNESGPPPKFYNPNYGYEPYWPGGDWRNEDDPQASSTTPVPLVCGRECHYLFRPIKKICARDHYNAHYIGCWNRWHHYCQGMPPDILHGYTTFDTYCEFLNAQCTSRLAGRWKKILNNWVFVHVGECVENHNLSFKPMYYENDLFSRMKFYISSQADSFLKVNKTPCS